ncbi:MAG: FecR domain-containing protein [Bdellovibrionales bacterium]
MRSVSDEVLRRPPTRLLWHAVNTGDPLFNGEAIRTSPLGEVRVQFEDGRYIDIEPDSLIVLSKAEGEISLDLMEGGLFVNAKSETNQKSDAPSSGLVLKSAQGKVDLSGASATLSKSSGQDLNLQVVEGSAKIQSKDGQTKEISSGKAGVLGSSGLQFDTNQIKILSPTPNKAVFLDPEKKPEISFRWTGFPADWKVSVMAGQQRRQMKELQTLDPGSEQAVISLALGRHYWKVVAKDRQTNEVKAESSVYRLDVMARSTPLPLVPTANANLELEQLPTAISFQWQKPEELSQLILEVASDPLLKNKIVTQRVDGLERFQLPDVAAGTYYWRLSAFFPGESTPWSGSVQKFTVLQKAEEAPTQVQIAWDQVPTTQQFVQEPQLQLSWNADPLTEKVAQWKVTWHEESQSADQAETLETSETRLQTKLKKPGRYLASVEAFDQKGRSIGKSQPLTVGTEERPLLPSPQLLPATEKTVMAQPNGRSDLSWTQVEAAKEYELVVVGKNGEELLKKRYRETKTTLVNLMPGEYTVQLNSVDEFDRISEKPVKRALIVPEKSNLRAPAVKRVKVN